MRDDDDDARMMRTIAAAMIKVMRTVAMEMVARVMAMDMARNDDRPGPEPVGCDSSGQGTQSKEHVACKAPGQHDFKRDADLGRQPDGQGGEDQLHIMGGRMSEPREVDDALLVGVERGRFLTGRHVGQLAEGAASDKGVGARQCRRKRPLSRATSASPSGV